jgi:hypothetical protein
MSTSEANRGRLYRVGKHWYLDTALLQTIARRMTVEPMQGGYQILAPAGLVRCVPASGLALPGQTGDLFRCQGQSQDQDVGARLRKLAGVADVADVIGGEWDQWPSGAMTTTTTPAKSCCGSCAAGGACGATPPDHHHEPQLAWLSDAQHSPFQDFAHGPQTVGIPYVRPDGVRVANDWDDLILNGPGDGIIVTETGETLLYKPVWTGTAPSGKAFDPMAHCKAWSSSALGDTSRRGRSGVDKQQAAEWTTWSDQKQWTSQLSYTCNNAHRIYCFEQ